MRGTYTATYLNRVAADFAGQRGGGEIDIGGAFDMIVGTSTGGIIACALAANVPLERVVDLYRKHGPAIFERRLPNGLNVGLVQDLRKRSKALSRGESALRTALHDVLGDMTLKDVYDTRKIAMSITAIELSQHRSWVFKTPHIGGSSGRDNGYKLVDVCLATSAAPIYRSLAALDHPDGSGGFNVFADGGLPSSVSLTLSLSKSVETSVDPINCRQSVPGFCSSTASNCTKALIVLRGVRK